MLSTFALTLCGVSTSSLAVDQVNNDPLNQQPVGVVSATAGSNLSSLENALSAKAEAAGAKSYRIISTTGQNKLHGTAIIYQ
ncbi:DUF1471 domain-containing protein [Martelella alba]|uniref:DUF1471 domain-containing protein n=2 Tax=Martelella alba TaxID=2590451 RepID=A0ABY2SIT5_9HYPH|nr:DUF1471 domain-containing protein [Martelella alba]